MYLARFSYDVTPVNRQRAIDFILREVKAARQAGLNARLLVPLTRSHSAAALQFELELAHLDQLDQFRERGVGTSEETGNWMRGFSEILVSPPLVEFCAWRRRNNQRSPLGRARQRRCTERRAQRVGTSCARRGGREAYAQREKPGLLQADRPFG